MFRKKKTNVLFKLYDKEFCKKVNYLISFFFFMHPLLSREKPQKWSAIRPFSSLNQLNRNAQ